MTKTKYFLILAAMFIAAVCVGQEAAPVVAAAAPSPAEAPEWLVKALELVSSVPVVGPIVVEVAKWLGVLSSVLTILVTAILGIIRALGVVLPAIKLADLAAKVLAFENSKVMYWLKLLSMYNAKKVDSANPK